MSEKESIKKVIKKVCDKKERLDLYNIICDVFEYVIKHDNMVMKTKSENVKEIIDGSDLGNEN